MQLRNLLLLTILAISFTGCDAIAGIFRAGFWVGIVLVLVIVGLVGLVVSRGRKR